MIECMIMFCAFYNYISLFLPAQIYKSSCILCTLRTRLISTNRVHILILIYIYTYIAFLSRAKGNNSYYTHLTTAVATISLFTEILQIFIICFNIGKLECYYLHKQPSLISVFVALESDPV